MARGMVLRARPGARVVDAKQAMTERYPGTEAAVARHFLFGDEAPFSGAGSTAGAGTMKSRLGWDMVYDEAAQSLWSFVDFRKDGMLGNTQGYVHGGCLGAVFDGALGTLFTVSGTAGFTANLSIDYRKPVEIPSVLLLFCSIDKVEGRKIYISGTLTEPLVDEPSGLPSTDARVYTEATALFLALKEHE